jgi:general secretion pathway protein C
MTLLLLFQKYVREILLLLLVLLGFSFGQLTATLLGLGISQPGISQPVPVSPRSKKTSVPPLASYKPILQRNLFHAEVGDLSDFGGQATTTQPAAPSSRANTKLTLLGTVSGEPKALAIIEAERETDSYLLGATLPGGAKLVEIQRNQVVIEINGRRETLKINLDAPSTATSGRKEKSISRSSSRSSVKQAQASSSGIREIGENRWLIPAEEAERARSNINELLRQARVEPNIVDGRTDGFVVRMIRPGSLFSMLGIQVGDVLRNVNGVQLDTPEKALQIFQQLREAKQISIALERQGAPQTFAYEIN